MTIRVRAGPEASKGRSLLPPTAHPASRGSGPPFVGQPDPGLAPFEVFSMPRKPPDDARPFAGASFAGALEEARARAHWWIYKSARPPRRGRR